MNDINGYLAHMYQRSTHERSFLIGQNKATLTERYQLEQLFETVKSQLYDIENHWASQGKRRQSGIGKRPQEIGFNDSLGALFFWFNTLEEKVNDFNRKTVIDTEYGPRLKRIRKRIRLIIRTVPS